METHRVAVITGATSGMGAAIARLLANAGDRVAVCGRRADRLTELSAQAGASGGEILPVPGDVTERGVIQRLFTAVSRRWGCQPDTFVLCAGVGLPGTLLTSDESRWQRLIEVNYLAAARQLRDCAMAFAGNADGDPQATARDIVVIGSTVGRQVSAFNPVYGSTKFALHSLVEALRQEVCGKSIRVTLVEPGFVTTEFQRAAGYDDDWFASLEKEFGPFLAADDVARVVEFVLRQPVHVHLDDIRIRPTRQRA